MMISLNDPLSSYTDEEKRTAHEWQMCVANGLVEDANSRMIWLINNGIVAMIAEGKDSIPAGTLTLHRLGKLA